MAREESYPASAKREETISPKLSFLIKLLPVAAIICPPAVSVILSAVKQAETPEERFACFVGGTLLSTLSILTATASLDMVYKFLTRPKNK